MKLEGIQNKNLTYASSLVDYLLDNPLSTDGRPKGFKARFGSLFNETDLLMAAAIHPNFKLPVVSSLNPEKLDMIRDKLIKEVGDQITVEQSITSSTVTEDGNYFDLYKVIVIISCGMNMSFKSTSSWYLM